jgi:hypothetical protein
MQLAALDDLECPGAGLGDGRGERCPLIGGVSEDALDKREEAARASVEDEPRAVAVLRVGAVDDDVQQEPERVDKDVPLAAGDLFARIIALRVERRAPFCAALALWLSMIAAVGLASWPSRSRVAT